MPAINHVSSAGSRAWCAPTAVIPGLPYFRVGAGHARDQSREQRRVARMALSGARGVDGLAAYYGAQHLYVGDVFRRDCERVAV